jgi:MFS family permease
LITSTIPGVKSVCLSRVANVLGGGFNIIITNAVIADLFGGSSSASASSGSTTTTGGAQAQQGMGAALGTQAAYASLGFLLGSLIGGRLTEIGERWAYGACSLLSALAMGNVVFRMTESLDYNNGGGYHNNNNSRRLNSNDDNDKNNIQQQQHCKEQGLMPTTTSSSSSSSSLSLLMTKFIEAPLSSIRLLYNYGPKMRTLATLLILQSIPMFMGDVFQLFAKEVWNLRPREFANLVAAFGMCVCVCVYILIS